MDDKNAEILISVMEENWLRARQSEDQRAAIAGFVVVIFAAIQGGLTQIGLVKNALPLTITLIFLGLIGAMASAKLHERHEFYLHRARKIRDRLEELYPETKISLTLNTANTEHEKMYPTISKRIRLNKIWLGLHLLIMGLGIIYTTIIFIR